MTHATDVRLTPELQAEYQQTYNDPAQHGSAAWYVAAKGLHAAGLIDTEPSQSDDVAETLGVANSDTRAQTL